MHGIKDKGDLTPAGEKFCEILQQLTGTSSPTTSVKSMTPFFNSSIKSPIKNVGDFTRDGTHLIGRDRASFGNYLPNDGRYGVLSG